MKNRYIGRTFIAPDQQASAPRRCGASSTRCARTSTGKRLVVVDDSIVRGTTTRAMVEHAARGRRHRGAPAHLLAAVPWPCFYGIDTPDRDELLAAHHDHRRRSNEFLGVDSLEYLTLENLRAAIDAPGAGSATPA